MYKDNSGKVYKYSVYVDVYFIMYIIKCFKLRLFIFIIIYN